MQRKTSILPPLLVILLWATLLVLPAHAQSHGDAAVDDAALIEQIDTIAEETLAQPGAVGLQIAVARGDELILAKGFGLADVENEVPMTASSMLRIGSVTKQYTAALILKLAEEGKLSLDDALTTYVDYPVGHREVTIRHLLNHTSGIPSYTGLDEFWKKHSSRDLTDEEMLELVRDRPFDFEPGERFLYNNTGYYLLGMIIAKVTGRTYADALHVHLLEPLGLEETRYDMNMDIVPHRARGYTISPIGLANAQPIGMRNPGAAGGLIATAADVLRWQQLLVSGSVVSDESYQKMIEPTRLADGSTENYGFGLATAERFDKSMVLHSGGINGFSSMLLYIPDEQLHVAVLSNNAAVVAGEPAMRIAAAALGIAEDMPEDLPVPQAMVERIEGEYLIEGIDLPIAFWGEHGALQSRAAGQPQVRLLHQGDGVFRAHFDKSLRITFMLDEDAEQPVNSFVLEQRGAKFKGRRVGAEATAE